MVILLCVRDCTLLCSSCIHGLNSVIAAWQFDMTLRILFVCFWNARSIHSARSSIGKTECAQLSCHPSLGCPHSRKFLPWPHSLAATVLERTGDRSVWLLSIIHLLRRPCFLAFGVPSIFSAVSGSKGEPDLNLSGAPSIC